LENKTGLNLVDPPAVAKNAILRSGVNSGELALDAQSGNILWNATLGGIDCPPIAVNGVIYACFRTPKGNVYALNASNGNIIWNSGVVNSQSYGTFHSATFADGVLYMGSADYNLYAFNASNGKKIWDFTASYIVSRVSSVVKWKSCILARVSVKNSYVYALNATNGQKIWDFAPLNRENEMISTWGRWFLLSRVGSFTLAARNTFFYALNASSGRAVWNYTTINGNIRVFA
jgi:outer membrane protein assembly factor BamB